MLYRFFRFMFRCFFYTIFRLKVYGMDNIPLEGPVILCANHISLFDPPIVGTPLKRRVYYMAKAELFGIPGLGWLIRQFGAFPVKRGGVSKDSIRHSIELLKSGNMLGIFPEGTRRNSSGVAQKGAASLALKSNAVVIPVAIIGQYKWFKSMHIQYGTPIDMSEFSENISAQDLEKATEKIMTTVRKMVETHK